MVTLKTIADKAGVTVSVVSRALNPRPDRHARVAPETKARIEETARSLGFRRNRNAEFLKRGKSPVIQVFLPCRACGLQADLVFGMAEAAEKENFSLSFSHGVSETGFGDFLRHAVLNRSCGALALQPAVSPGFWENQDPEVKSLKMVALNPRHSLPDCFPTLSLGFREAGALAAKRLLSRGCSSLAVLGRAALRVNGFQTAATASGVSVRQFLPTEQSAFMDWIRQQPKPVGVFALTDILAMKVLTLVQRLELKVPSDVCLIGHDDQHFGAYLEPALTTVRQLFREQGREAIQMVIRMIYDETVESRVIPPVLVARKSA